MSLLAPPPDFVLRDYVERALREDLGRGDVTTDACIPRETQGTAILVAREALTLSGLPVFALVMQTVDEAVEVSFAHHDGDSVPANTTVASVRGPARSLLKAERVALNFVQRMSGIASKTKSYVSALPQGSGVRITDTRKTTPLLRALERYAVRCGGGHNHRDDLSSAVLIKDNHIAACGGISKAIQNARAHAPHTSRIECEVDRLEQLREALAAGADIIMLDNFSDRTLREAVAVNQGKAILEVSGGVTLERIATIAESGIDIISVGGLTHSARAVDLALDWTE